MNCEGEGEGVGEEEGGGGRKREKLIKEREKRRWLLDQLEGKRSGFF